MLTNKCVVFSSCCIVNCGVFRDYRGGKHCSISFKKINRVGCAAEWGNLRMYKEACRA